MANQDIPVSGLQNTNSITTEDLALVTVVDELSATGYTSKHITEGNRARQYLGNFTWQDLQTEAKDIFGAINEAATTGGNDVYYIHWTTPSTITETGADIAAAYADGSDLVILLTDSQTGQVYTLPLTKVDDNAGALNLSFGATVYKKTQVVALLQLLKPAYTIQGMNYEKVSTAAINDTTTTSTTETWSAKKINDTITAKTEIDDTTTTTTTTWSSDKIADELTDKAEIADTVVSTASAWSSSQIVSMLPTESASGAVASFETPLTLPLVSHNVTIEPVQAGTGDPSPSNPRAISGHSSVTISHSGEDTSDPTEITINLGQTVYGGTFNATTGVLTSNFVIYNLGDLNYIYEPAGTEGVNFGRFRTSMTGHKPAGKVICEIYKGLQVSIASLVDLSCCISGSVTYPFLRIRDDNYSNADVFKNSLNNRMVICELATPVEITLTPEQINTLKGVNNIWADTGDTSVEFKQDIQTYIDSRLSSGTRSLSLAKVPVETKEETKQEEQEVDENVER